MKQENWRKQMQKNNDFNTNDDKEHDYNSLTNWKQSYV